MLYLFYITPVHTYFFKFKIYFKISRKDEVIRHLISAPSSLKKNNFKNLDEILPEFEPIIKPEMDVSIC